MPEERQPWTAQDLGQADAGSLDDMAADISESTIVGDEDEVDVEPGGPESVEEPDQADIEELTRPRRPRDLANLSREELEGAYLRMADYTRKLQGVAEVRKTLSAQAQRVAELERTLEDRIAELEELREQLLGRRPAAAEDEDEDLPRSINECVNEDGTINMEKLAGYVKRMVNERMQPLTEQLSEAEKRQYEADLQRAVERFEQAHQRMVSVFPHYAEDELVQQKTAQTAQAILQQEPEVVLRAAYAVAFPTEYARAVLQAAERRTPKAPPPLRGAATEAREKPPAPGERGFLDALTADIVKAIEEEQRRRPLT